MGAGGGVLDVVLIAKQSIKGIQPHEFKDVEVEAYGDEALL
jgi:hypothetical protein